MRYLIPLCAVLLIGCSDSPTAPSPVNTAPAPIASQPTPSPAPSPSLTPSDLHWDRIGAGCEVHGVPSPIPDVRDATIEREGDAAVMAYWPRYRSSDGRDGLLYARFVPSNGEYALCTWDMSDL